MGTLRYDGVMIEFEDRLLAHLQIVIAQKVRRGESFFMAWRDSPETGDGHSSIWIHPTQNLYFKFSGSRFPKINSDWVEALMNSANSSKGLLIMTEDSVTTIETDSITLATASPHLQDLRPRHS
ncbi:DUF7882 family protein [Leifsonia sp. 22587]|uniref:DUF7882 family protein n=1 Tax=Leifsonia sp. 22587 TaxID=3453946 RepID=UPI003F828AC1